MNVEYKQTKATKLSDSEKIKESQNATTMKLITILNFI